MTKNILLGLVAYSGLLIAKIDKPYLSETLSTPTGASDCVIKEFQKASPFPYADVSVDFGPGAASLSGGGSDETTAEFLLTGKLSNGKIKGYWLDFPTDDGSKWLYDSSGSEIIGMYSTVMKSAANVRDPDTFKSVFSFSVDACAQFLSH